MGRARELHRVHLVRHRLQVEVGRPLPLELVEGQTGVVDGLLRSRICIGSTDQR